MQIISVKTNYGDYQHAVQEYLSNTLRICFMLKVVVWYTIGEVLIQEMSELLDKQVYVLNEYFK